MIGFFSNWTRQHFLVAGAVVSLLGCGAYWIASTWGRITIIADSKPFGEVLREFQRKSRLPVRANGATDEKVTVHIENQPLAKAMEMFADAVGGRWRLTYAVAPDKGALASGWAAWQAGEMGDAWKTFHMPMPPMFGGDGGSDAGFPDPRGEKWNVKPAADGNLHAYLSQGSIEMDAAFLVPAQFNPAVKQPPSGRPANVVKALAKSAKGVWEEVFALRRGRGGPGRGEGRREREASPPGGGADVAGDRPRGPFGEGVSPEAMRERMESRIAKLPPEQQEEARQRMEERRKFFEGLRELPEEERRAKIAEHFSQMMNSPEAQSRFENRMSRQSPEQRHERHKRYVERKKAGASAGQ